MVEQFWLQISKNIKFVGKTNKTVKKIIWAEKNFSHSIFCITTEISLVYGILEPCHSHNAQTFFKSCPRFRHAVQSSGINTFHANCVFLQELKKNSQEKSIFIDNSCLIISYCANQYIFFVPVFGFYQHG